ncbi:hypothetical protein [Kitasatospora sp. NBC_00315]|uniref:hypothetical protein n=1 Tax=Kitasatospora sp. NBC_00315 TaxID=2975963 RepID=UPI003252C586
MSSEQTMVIVNEAAPTGLLATARPAPAATRGDAVERPERLAPRRPRARRAAARRGTAGTRAVTRPSERGHRREHHPKGAPDA